MKNALNWFEIPSSDFSRALKFYSAVFNAELYVENMGDMQLGIFPYEGDGAAGGAVVHGPFQKPSAQGTLVYLNANDGMDAMIARIEKAGGTIIMPRTQISAEIGYMAIFSDSEGNSVALHSNS